MSKTKRIPAPAGGRDERPLPVAKLSRVVHSLAKQIANETGEEIGQVIERHALDGLTRENEAVQAAIKSRIPARRA